MVVKMKIVVSFSLITSLLVGVQGQTVGDWGTCSFLDKHLGLSSSTNCSTGGGIGWTGGTQCNPGWDCHVWNICTLNVRLWSYSLLMKHCKTIQHVHLLQSQYRRHAPLSSLRGLLHLQRL